MKKSTFVLMAFGMVLTTICLIAVIIFGSRRQKHEIQKALNSPAVLRLKSIEANWKAESFTAISSGEDLGQLIANRISQAAGYDRLSEPKKKLLADAIGKLLTAYSSPDPADYLAFRIPPAARNSPNAYKFNQQKIADYVRALPSLETLKKISRENGASAPDLSEYNLSDPLYVFTQYRNLLFSASHNPKNKFVACVDCWTGANLENLALHLETKTNRQAEVTALNVIHSLPNIGFVKPASSVVFSPSPGELIASQGYVECATVVLTVQVERSGVQAYPVSVLWYWSPAQADWLPYEIILLCKINSTDLFF